MSVLPGSIGFTFQDQADNEIGFEVRRSENDPGSDCGVGSIIATVSANAGTGLVAFNDNSVSSDTAYWYSVTAFNSGGTSGACSNHVNVLSATGVRRCGVVNCGAMK